ncbi:polyamine aminopropyltransferase [Desulfitibacter alkalitolerans]|uniref:polyamine aminopropyltransferase n=1 Tax=Desulfitibacter alkalitolerans TaxID=264641 RepID=UPI0004898CC1|nr:polyamine aminopropyltransferase [Desulfitibacter alkalitolerans]
MEGIWFTEKQLPGLAVSCLVKKTLHHEKSEYQDVKVVETDTFGTMLLLDNVIQTNVRDEFIYHEMISFPALNTHPNPENVLVIGGGDGGTIREVAKHPRVKKATLVEIDGVVVEVSKKYLPTIAAGLEDPKVEVKIDDGIKHVKDNKNTYDVILVDSTDPIGPAVGLFAKEFYTDVFNALKEDGIFVAQTASPVFNGEMIKRIHKDLGEIFPVKDLYVATIPTYPGGYWCFTMGSKKHSPREVAKESIAAPNTRYYSPDVHFGALALPPFVEELVK